MEGGVPELYCAGEPVKLFPYSDTDRCARRSTILVKSKMKDCPQADVTSDAMIHWKLDFDMSSSLTLSVSFHWTSYEVQHHS